MGNSNSRCLCPNYKKGLCECSTCIDMERRNGIYPKHFRNNITYEKYTIPTKWIVNDHRSGQTKIISTSSEGFTRGFHFGLEFSFVKSAFNKEWIESKEESITRDIPPGYKGRFCNDYEKKTLKHKYLTETCYGDYDGEFVHPNWVIEIEKKVMDLEYLVCNRLELVPLIKTHIFRGIQTMATRTIHSFQYCTIQVNHSRKYIDVEGSLTADNTKVIQWFRTNNTNQMFTLSFIEGSNNKGYFLSESSGNKKSIGIIGDLVAGAPIVVRPINSQSPRQTFKIEFNYCDGDNYWCIISCESDRNLVWEIEDDSSADGKRLVLGRRNGRMNQLFSINNS
jgi:hypothetical protein